MSLLVVISDDELTAYSLVQRPFEHKQIGSASDPRLITTLSLLTDALKLRELINSTESGRFWYENDQFFEPSQRVDSVLLDNLLQAFRGLKDDLGSEAAQALLMQTMFIAYLEDRKIVTPPVLRNASNGACSTFKEILSAKSTGAFESLFAWLNKAFNGNIFNAPCAFELGDVAPPKLKTRHLRVLADFRHGRVEMSSGQLRLFGYDFQYMPIGLISAVYDRFLKEEAERKNKDGAFYTPMFLADVVVNQVWDELSDEQRAKGVFCDPACGSGIFLVRLFQRMVAHHCRIKNKRYATWKELTSIAQRLHGGDTNAAAVRVAAFSLYIALLEHSNPPDLPALLEKGKLLPSLYRNTLRPLEDFFNTGNEAQYDAIIGNPPWKGRAGQVTTAQQWVDTRSLPYPAKDIAWGFVWKSLEVLKPTGLIGLLLPAMGVLHSGESQEARRHLLRTAKVKRVINFSDLCFQLFDGAQRPTAFVLCHRGDGNDVPYRLEYWTPKADLNLRLKRVLTLARSDRSRLRSDDVAKDPSIFKRRLWMRAPDEKLLQYLRTFSALSKFIDQFKALHGRAFDRESNWIIGQGFKPARPNRLHDENYKTVVAPIVKDYPYLDADVFVPLALPNVQAASWPDEIVHRAGFSDGFVGPHIIIPQGVERSDGRVRAAYTEQSLVFRSSLQAVAFPDSERSTAKLLTAILNSRLAAWFYFHETAYFGTERAKVLQEDLLKLPFAVPRDMPNPKQASAIARRIVQLVDAEIEAANGPIRSTGNALEQIDVLAYAYYGLDTSDVALVEDCFNYTIPAMQPRRSAGLQPIWAGSHKEQRSAYAKFLCDALGPWFRKSISASLVARSSDIAILKLSIDRSPKENIYSEEVVPDLEPFLQQISANLQRVLPGNTQLTPDLRFVIGQDMYLVKPMQLRYWLRSTALADAEQLAADFSGAIARGDKKDMHDARG